MKDIAPSDPRGAANECPALHGRALPTDGTQLRLSPTLAAWRDEAAATPLQYADGHVGWIVTRNELAKEILLDPRFTRETTRLPMPGDPHADIDADAQESIRVGGPLDNDGDVHARLRRAIAPRFSLKAARSYRAKIAEIVQAQIGSIAKHVGPVDLTSAYAAPISAQVHCLVMGVPDRLSAAYSPIFVGESTLQRKFDFAREALALKQQEPGDDVLSDLVRSDLSPHEQEGLALVVLSAGRDSVAHLISTSVVALLLHREQWDWLGANPDRMPAAVEEFVRVGSLFVTLFSRTAKEDLTIGSLEVQTGQSVSVAVAAANRDERQFDNPEQFDVTRDAFGHLGFGHGIHACVGQQVARTVIAEAVWALMERWPGLRLVDAEQLRPLPFAHPVATHATGQVLVEWEQ
ncbi:cytochrome P450 [Arthrobacter sp. M4]|uniref:cytochrome P450 n=1 Tax=Arthrobacter sp. M4 TaxID=218160 RepID=UPI001CDD26E5|nr:cytochrome P450 [Arthrobacter sp. M4]MCA4132584.1 cytochrome P450 [Arthrobacter sp. M4]